MASKAPWATRDPMVTLDRKARQVPTACRVR